MSKRSGIDQPLYNSVRSLILTKLRAREWLPGTKIPTEPELAKLFAVSVGTVRKAVEDLVLEKVLIRRARIGTTVATHEQQNQFSTFFNFLARKNSEMVIEQKLLSFQKVLADSALATILKVREGDPLIMIDNLRIINGHPAMYDRIWLPQKEIFKTYTEGF